MLATLFAAAYYSCIDSARLYITTTDDGKKAFRVRTKNLHDMSKCTVNNNTQLFLDIIQGQETRLVDEKYYYITSPDAVQVIDAPCGDFKCQKVVDLLNEGDVLTVLIHDNMFRSLIEKDLPIMLPQDWVTPTYNYYQTNGTLVIPISNVSFAFSLFKNATTLVWSYEDTAITVWNDRMYHYVHIEGDKQVCTSLNVEWVEKKAYLPDLTEYIKLKEQQVVRGSLCDVFVRTAERKTTSANATYYADSLYSERFFCIPLNNDECLPVKWETHGKNPYIYYYNEFDFVPDDYVYVVPEHCNQTPAAQLAAQESVSTYGYIKRDKNLEKAALDTAEDAPESLDLRLRGMSTPVKDQAACGSCWAFATAAMLEGRVNAQLDREGMPLIRVSEQQILSCSWNENLGCSGGDADTALQQMIDDHGGRIPLQSCSPYKSFESQCDDSCFTDKYGRITAVKTLDKSKDALKQALLGGPVAVATAVPTSFSWYTGGVYNDPACGVGEDTDLVHAVTVVGWGVDALAGEYWIVKNSWSNNWGVDGYIYISNEQDLCGILQDMVIVELSAPFMSQDNIFGIVFGSIVAVAAAALLGVGAWSYYAKIKRSKGAGAAAQSADEKESLMKASE